MNFREYAAKEASDLAARLTEAAATAAEHAAKHAADEAQKITDALRGQFDVAVAEKTAIATQLHETRSHAEQLQAQLQETHAHGERLQADLHDVHARADRQQAELTESYAEAGRLQAQVNDAQQRAGELQAELDAARGHTDYIRAELSNVHSQAEHLQTELRNAQGYADHLHGELKNAQGRVEELQGQLGSAHEEHAALTAARDEQTAARTVAETELHNVRGTVDALRAELSSAMKTLDRAAAERLESEEAAAAAASQTQAAEAKMEAVQDLLKKSAARAKALEQARIDQDRTITNLEAKLQDLESKLQAPRSAPAPAPAASSPAAAILDDLMVGFQALGGATTIADVLTTLVEQMAAQFPRVALFRVKKGHLQGEHQIGFETYTDIAKLVLPLGMDSLPARAAGSGEIEILSGDALKASRAPFNGSPAFAVSVPIVVSGETVAIVYADDSGAARGPRGADVEEARARYAEGMQRYAMALVMRLTNELKALAELQRYAASLLQEIEQMYEADVQAGKGGADLRKRLNGNLEYARSIYASRAAIEGAGAAALIDDEVGALVEARAGTPFARDLAAAAGLGERNAAEAS